MSFMEYANDDLFGGAGGKTHLFEINDDTLDRICFTNDAYEIDNAQYALDRVLSVVDCIETNGELDSVSQKFVESDESLYADMTGLFGGTKKSDIKNGLSDFMDKIIEFIKKIWKKIKAFFGFKEKKTKEKVKKIDKNVKALQNLINSIDKDKEYPLKVNSNKCLEIGKNADSFFKAVHSAFKSGEKLYKHIDDTLKSLDLKMTKEDKKQLESGLSMMVTPFTNEITEIKKYKNFISKGKKLLKVSDGVRMKGDKYKSFLEEIIKTPIEMKEILRKAAFLEPETDSINKKVNDALKKIEGKEESVNAANYLSKVSKLIATTSSQFYEAEDIPSIFSVHDFIVDPVK